MAWFWIYTFTLCIYFASSDIYLHNPRGSNNRLDEEGRDRRNGNRLFDSQNNNRGGYNVGSLYYYAGSQLQIEWTSQHSCGTSNNHCEIILQYMCSDTLRDGATTSTIPDNPLQCQRSSCNEDLQFGMHEDYDYYLNCRLRKRNQGLFAADFNIRGPTKKAIHTRQNPVGTRRGYECPEERDYYPYWHPTPWKDIVVFTNNATRCSMYTKESQNVQGKGLCVLSRAAMLLAKEQGLTIPNSQQDCKNFKVSGLPEDREEKGVWEEFSSHEIPAPECREADFSRDNHLGNGLGGYPNNYNWTIPHSLEHEQCALRIRYNISTGDYPWDADSSYNKKDRPRDRGFYGEAAAVPLGERFSFDSDQEAAERGWLFKSDPQVKLFKGLPLISWQLAINTAQFGRTFQDRSHTFAVRPRPTDISPTASIHNLNVRGKRGNIVQVYPAVEYDFIPNTLELQKGSYIHVQWTGSNTNPHNNDGQGRAGSDRSNMVLQVREPYPLSTLSQSKHGHWGCSYPALLNHSTLLGLNQNDLKSLAFLSPGQFGGELSELDDAGTYFDLGVRRVTTSATQHYMSTRNNNFSNRSQKGRLIVSNAEISHHSVGINGASLSLNQGQVTINIESGVFPKLQKIRVESWSVEEGKELLESSKKKTPVGNDIVSSIINITPSTELTHQSKQFKIDLRVSSDDSTAVFKTDTGFNFWIKMTNAEIKSGHASFQTSSGGVYVAVRQINKVGIIVGVVVALVFVIAVSLATIFYFRRYPEKLNACTRSFRRTI